MQALQFGSRIRFVSPLEFEEAKTSRHARVTEWPDTGRYGDGPNTDYVEGPFFTEKIQQCNAGGITDCRTTVVPFHFQPWNVIAENFRNLQWFQDMMKAPKETLRALLVGGKSDDEESLALRDALVAKFRREGIPFSKFWGQPDRGVTNLAHSPQEDTWLVSVRHWPIEKPADDRDYLPHLREAFAQIHLAKGDDLLLGNTTFKPEEVNDRFKDPDAAS